MTDLTERLRKRMGLMTEIEVWETCEEAADEIDRLRDLLRVAEAGLYAAILRTAPKTDPATSLAQKVVYAALQETGR